MENFGKFMAILLGLIIGPIINGYVIVKLWGWFVVPTFELNPLRLVEAIGLMVLIHYVKSKRDRDAENAKFWPEFGLNSAYLIINTGFVLFIGWILQMFM